MKKTNPAPAAILLGTVAMWSCKPKDELTPIEMAAETGGDEGLIMPEVDLPEDESEEVPLPPGQCLQQPHMQTYGYVHQCEGVIRIGFAASSYTGEDSFKFGPGKENPLYWLDPDSYELPLVAACCGPFNYENPTTEQKLPYVNNCLFDSVQQICHGIPHLLRRQAEQTKDAVKKLALNSLAKDLEDKAGECLVDLYAGGAPQDAPNRLSGTAWAPKQNVTFTLIEAEITDWTEEGEVAWNTCYSMFENDPAVVPTVPLEVPGTVAVTNGSLLANSTAEAAGPGGLTANFSITAEDSTLTLAHGPDGEVGMSGLRLVADASHTADADDAMLTHASLTLRNVAGMPLVRGRYEIGPGEAQFVVMLAFEGDSRIVDMTNTTAVVLSQRSMGQWELSPFDLEYYEPESGVWTLSLGQLSFVT